MPPAKPRFSARCRWSPRAPGAALDPFSTISTWTSRRGSRADEAARSASAGRPKSSTTTPIRGAFVTPSRAARTRARRRGRPARARPPPTSSRPARLEDRRGARRRARPAASRAGRRRRRRGRAVRPLLESTSGTPPVREATTGTPAASASRTVSGLFSHHSEGTTSRSSDSHMGSCSSGGTRPRKRIRGLPPAESTQARAVVRVEVGVPEQIERPLRAREPGHRLQEDVDALVRSHRPHVAQTAPRSRPPWTRRLRHGSQRHHPYPARGTPHSTARSRAKDVGARNTATSGRRSRRWVARSSRARRRSSGRAGAARRRRRRSPLVRAGARRWARWSTPPRPAACAARAAPRWTLGTR